MRTFHATNATWTLLKQIDSSASNVLTVTYACIATVEAVTLRHINSLFWDH